MPLLYLFAAISLHILLQRFFRIYAAKGLPTDIRRDYARLVINEDWGIELAALVFLVIFLLKLSLGWLSR